MLAKHQRHSGGVANSGGKVDQHGVSSGVQVPTENSDLNIFFCIYCIFFVFIVFLYFVFFRVYLSVFIALEYRCLKLLFSYVSKTDFRLAKHEYLRFMDSWL